MDTKITNHEKKRNNLDFIKIKNFYFSKDILKIWTGQATDSDKIFTVYASDERHVSIIYK